MLQNRGERDAQGFTLVEILIVIAIIGVLAAIAIPNFLSYRQRSFDSATISDLRHAMTIQEGYFVDHATFTASTTSLSAKGWQPSPNVTLVIAAASTGGYTMSAYHSSGESTWTVHGPGGEITRGS